jgi:penicillin-binding protein 1A
VQMSTLYFGASVAGGTFPAEIWHDYMDKAKGKYCGGFKPPKTPFHSSPFFGKYARGGGPKADDSSTEPSTGVATGPAAEQPSTGAATPDVDPAPDDAAPDQGGDGNGDFDPDKYEAPPQPSPNGDDGGTQAPG